jgi:hypothetical protein
VISHVFRGQWSALEREEKIKAARRLQVMAKFALAASSLLSVPALSM